MADPRRAAPLITPIVYAIAIVVMLLDLFVWRP